MHIPTHLLSSWCIANHVPRLGPRQRLFAMLAGTLPDLDGLGLLVSQECYCTYHHVLGHNLVFAFVLSALLAWFSPARVKSFVLYFLLFHLHLVMDYYGSGRGWGIEYFWPFSHHSVENPQAWHFDGWQNRLALVVCTLWTAMLFFVHGRTPLERIVPAMDRVLCGILRRWRERLRPAPAPADEA